MQGTTVRIIEQRDRRPRVRTLRDVPQQRVVQSHGDSGSIWTALLTEDDVLELIETKVCGCGVRLQYIGLDGRRHRECCLCADRRRRRNLHPE